MSQISRGRGRPGKLTLDIQTELASMIQDGIPVDVAAGVCSIHSDTFYTWMRRGREASILLQSEGEIPESEILYLDFFEAITRARELCEAEMSAKWKDLALRGVEKRTAIYKEEVVTQPDGSTAVVKILDKEIVETAGDGDWRAIAEYLARRAPSRWAKKGVVEHVGPDGGPLQIDSSPVPLDKLSPELKRRILEELEGGNVIEAEAQLLPLPKEDLKVAPPPVPGWYVKLQARRAGGSRG